MANDKKPPPTTPRPPKAKAAQARALAREGPKIAGQKHRGVENSLEEKTTSGPNMT